MSETLSITYEPPGERYPGDIGTSLLSIASRNGLNIAGPCGGQGTCGKCRVIPRGRVTERTASEAELITPADLEAGVRLSCQICALEPQTVTIPPETVPVDTRILTTGLAKPVDLWPGIEKRYLELSPPDLEDQRGDLDRLLDALAAGTDWGGRIASLRAIPDVVREGDYKVTATVADGRLLDVEPGDTSTACLGVAVDIGTTTVVGYLLDLRTGQQLAVSSVLNPQSPYGADVLLRLSYIQAHGERGLRTLRTKIVAGVNDLIAELCETGGVCREHIYRVVVAGNTIMHHLFGGVDAQHIGPIPFAPVINLPLTLPAAEIGLAVNRSGEVHMLPNLGGYVGADIVADLLATDLDSSTEPRLLIDIGTNAEMILTTGEELLACSAPAGPAFEGANISCGMRGADGAVDSVAFEAGEVRYTTLGDAWPLGVCGSGLLDLMSEVLRVGVVDTMGRMLGRDELPDSARAFADRVGPGDRGNRFRFVDAGEGAAQGPVHMTQGDVRELQMAKAAVRTGVEVLLQAAGIKAEDLSEILLAGAFGTFLRREAAVGIGLIPRVPIDRITPVGNAAGEGAKLALLSRAERERAASLLGLIRYIELSNAENFNDMLMEQVLFHGE